MEKVDVQIIQKVESAVPAICTDVDACVIWDPESLNKAADLGKFLVETKKLVEMERKRITDPLNKSLKAANSLFKKFSDPLDRSEIVLKGKIAAYRRDEERRIAEEKRKIAEEERKRAEEAIRLKIDILEVDTIPPPVVDAAPKARGTFGSVVPQKRWTYSIKKEAFDEAGNVLPNLIPAQFLMVDDRKVKEAISAGVRDIPGIEIFQKEIETFR